MGSIQETKCTPCEGSIRALTDEEEDKRISDLNSWNLHRDGVHKLKKSFTFPTYASSIVFVGSVAKTADTQGHHPIIHIFYKKVTIEFYTHSIKALSINDFIMASNIDSIYNSN